MGETTNQTVLVGGLDHLPDLVQREGLAGLDGQPLDVHVRDLPVVVLVDDLEGLVELLPGVALAHLVGHHVHELVEVDRPAPVLVHLRDHLVYLLWCHLKPQCSHGDVELLWINGTYKDAAKQASKNK